MRTKINKHLVAALGVLALGASNAEAVSFNFSSVSGAKIQFDGAGNFAFQPETTGNDVDFKITSGSAANLTGDIGGIFSIGDITPSGLGFAAPVTGTGTFTIYDGANWLTASITWDKMYQKGVGDTLNVDGVVNLKDISYGGVNSDLHTLFEEGSGINVVTFQFVPARSLSYLKSTSIGTSFSGSVTSVPVPDGGTTAVFMGAAFLCLGFVSRIPMRSSR